MCSLRMKLCEGNDMPDIRFLQQGEHVGQVWCNLSSYFYMEHHFNLYLLLKYLDTCWKVESNSYFLFQFFFNNVDLCDVRSLSFIEIASKFFGVAWLDTNQVIYLEFFNRLLIIPYHDFTLKIALKMLTDSFKTKERNEKLLKAPLFHTTLTTSFLWSMKNGNIW